MRSTTIHYVNQPVSIRLSVTTVERLGARARLLGTGKDVWEVIAVVRDNDGDIAETARYLELPLGLVHAAVAYYGAFPTEIDEWIDLNQSEATEARAAWLAGRAALKR